jgi:LytS/YehU family sensor histidine kinase
MMLSLALAILLVATLGVDAAPQATSKKKAETSKIAQMVTVSGECTKLVQAGVTVDGCKPVLMNLNYSTGVSAYWFMTEGTILSFSGDGSRHVEQGPDVVVQAIEKVIRAATIGVLREEDTKEETAIGFCRFGNPTIKGSTLECVAHTQAGRYEGVFVTNGSRPTLETFQVNQ